MDRSLVMVWVALLGCAPSDPCAEAGDCKERRDPTPEAPAACDGATAAPDPADGAGGVATDVSPAFALSPADDAATLALTDSAGVLVPGEVTHPAPGLVAFSPDAPLEPGATYSLDLAWMCGSGSSGFTTAGSGGAPVGLVLGDGTVEHPTGFGPVLAALLTGLLLFEVLDDSGPLDARAATTNEGASVQDRCIETIDSLDNDFAAPPAFDARFERIVFNVEGTPVPLLDVVVSGELDPVEGVRDVQLRGWLDASFMDDLVGSDPCALFETFGTSCVACPTAALNVSCVPLHITAVPVVPWGQPIQERSAADIAADGQCP